MATGTSNQILSEAVGTSHASGRESLYPILLAMHEERMAGNPEDIGLSQRIGLMPEDHLALYGIRRTSAQGKRILEQFSIEQEPDLTPIEHIDNQNDNLTDDTESNGITGTQFSLDSF